MGAGCCKPGKDDEASGGGQRLGGETDFVSYTNAMTYLALRFEVVHQ